MSKLTTSDSWALTYPDNRSSARLLVCLPHGMLKDVHLVSKYQGVSASEFVRRAVTAVLAEVLEANPHAASSFSGVPMRPEAGKSSPQAE